MCTSLSLGGIVCTSWPGGYSVYIIKPEGKQRYPLKKKGIPH